MTPQATPAAQGPLALLLHQARYDTLASMRNPRARFFTFIFPILLLVIFSSVFGLGHTTIVDGTRVSYSRFFVGGIMAMTIITAAYAGLVITIATAREAGVLKRRRATPVPPAVLIGGQALSTLATAAITLTLLLVVTRIGYGVGFSVGTLAAMAIAAVVGTLTFACLAYAVAGLIPSPDAAQPIVQATMLPLYFISGVWIPTASLSPALRHISEIFPIEHLAAALHLASVRGSFTSALAPQDLLVLALWALASAVFATRRFSWLPATASA
ncbi:MAG: type transport system permease protein [Solirubrobacteraceae bacterium]|jgi:ABC-2 type transport system permease protein|nr:type transport system permease protein [Solirubrobacteraceae bacterium]